MRKFGIVIFTLCSLLIIFFIYAGITNRKGNYEVVLIPILFLILQGWLAGYYVQKQYRNRSAEKDILVDEPLVENLKMNRFYKISAVILSLFVLIVLIELAYVLLIQPYNLNIHGRQVLIFIFIGLIIVGLMICVFNLSSAFRKQKLQLPE